MKNIQINENSIQINIPKRLSKIQRAGLKIYLEGNQFDSALAYIGTFSARRNRGIYFPYKLNRGDRSGDSFKGNENKYLSLQEKLNRVSENHKPMSDKIDYVGIEIECIVPKVDEELSKYEEFSLLRDEIASFKLGQITVKEDGSIREESGYFGVEFNVLCPANNLSKLEKLCTYLNNIGAKVNKSCGLHIHLDARKIKNDTKAIAKIKKSFTNALPVLASMVPKSRRDNRYCFMKVGGSSRYVAVNTTALNKFGTIEIRLHSSTTDFNKIKEWITINQAIMRGEIKKSCKDVNQLTDYVYLPEQTIEYIGQRVELFNQTPAVYAPSVDPVDPVDRIETIRYVDNDSTESLAS